MSISRNQPLMSQFDNPVEMLLSLKCKHYTEIQRVKLIIIGKNIMMGDTGDTLKNKVVKFQITSSFGNFRKH